MAVLHIVSLDFSSTNPFGNKYNWLRKIKYGLHCAQFLDIVGLSVLRSFCKQFSWQLKLET